MNAEVYLTQVTVDMTAAMRHLRGFLPRTALDDDTLLLKTMLTEGFAGPLIRPWALHAQRGPRAIIVGYSRASADELNHRRGMALPTVQAAVQEALAFKLPDFSERASFRFALSFVPTVRVTPDGRRHHGEQDAYLVTTEKAGKDAGLKRDTVYADYIRQRMPGAKIESCRLLQFRLRKFARPKQDGFGYRTHPEAAIAGELTVIDPAALRELIVTGIGRQRAYGYGMLRLEASGTR